MIGWGSVIGRAVDFMVSKLLGRQIETHFDDKRRAARIFFELHHLVADLERFVTDLTVEMRDVATMGDTKETREWVLGVGVAVDRTSDQFFQRTEGLREVLEVVDPALAFAVGELEGSKFSFLAAATESAFPEDQRGHKDYSRLKISVASTDAESWSFDEAYERYRKHAATSTARPWEWPEGGIRNIAEAADAPDVILTLSDAAALLGFAARLDEHAAMLRRAREALGAFLRERFKVEDLLAVRNTVKKFDPIHARHRMHDSVVAPPRAADGASAGRSSPAEQDGGSASA